MKIMLDTNVLIDLVAARAPYCSDVRKLCIAAAFDDVQIWVSTQSYADAYCVLCKSASSEEVKRALLATLDMFLVCGTHAADLRPALESCWDDIEDCMIAHSSKRVPVEYFITRDKDLARRSPVPAMTARELLSLLESEYGLEYDDIQIEGD